MFIASHTCSEDRGCQVVRMSTPEPASVAWQWDEAAPISQDAASDLPLDNGDRLELGSVANLAVGSGLGMICSAGDGWDAG
jgi:hypothetical protein